MQKTGLKTFAYSFSVSLFAIFVANGVYWHEHPSKAPEIKIPSKNITLFLKSDATPPSNAQVPVKKIALSVLPDVKMDIPLAEPDDEIIMADDFSLPEIPLEFSIPPLEATKNDLKSTLALAENAAPPPQPISQEDEDIQKPDKIVIPLQVPGSTDIRKPQKAETPTPKGNAQSNTLPVLDAPLIIAEAAESSSQAPSSQEKKTAPTILAEQDVDIPLLPLEKTNDGAAFVQKNINIASARASNQVALVDKSIPIHSMETSNINVNSATKEPTTPSWENMSDKQKDTSSPWLVAKADGALKNQKMADNDFYKAEAPSLKEALSPDISPQGGVKIASETVKNLLIPIPEDILNDENLTPQLSYSPQNSQSKEPLQTEKAASTDVASKSTPPSELPTPPESSDERKNKLLSSLDAIFSAKNKKEPSLPQTVNTATSSRKKTEKANIGKIMPTEMRLSFQPNRAEISGQTLRWIQAFAAKAAEDRDMSIEIRIDGTAAMDLQQKRLNLLHNILADKGVEYSKINTVFTQREPNSFIIKTITHNRQKGVNRNINKAANGHYISW